MNTLGQSFDHFEKLCDHLVVTLGQVCDQLVTTLEDFVITRWPLLDRFGTTEGLLRAHPGTKMLQIGVHLVNSV